MEVSTRYPTQPHLFDRRPSAFPPFGHHGRDSYYSREMPSPYAPDTAHAQPYHHPSNREQPRISLPSISDLLNFTGEPDSRRAPTASQPRTEPAWQQSRSAYGSQLKVETTNIDPRLHRPLSSPVPSSAHPGSAPVLQRSPLPQSSPAFDRSADTEYAPHQLDYASSFDHHKRLSTVSQISHLSQTSTQSADSTHSSPDVAKSSTSSYSQRGSLGDQRALPSDFPPPSHTTSPQRRIHSPTRDQQHPYGQTTSQRSSHHYPQQASQRPPLIHQSSAASIVTAASAGSSRLEDRYVCPSCNKAFSRPSSLRIHSHSHTGEKPFRCPRKGCGKAFSVRSNMKRHERGCHVDSAGYHSPDEEHAQSPEHSS